MPFGNGESPAAIRHLDAQDPAALLGAHADEPTFHERIDSVLDRILDQREHHHRWHGHSGELLGHVDRVRETSPHPDVMDSQVGIDQPHFVAECRAGVVAASQRRERRQGSRSIVGSCRASPSTKS